MLKISKTLLALLALLSLAVLNACGGGGDNTYTVGASVNGLLSANSVVLQNNGSNNTTASANGTTTFSSPIAAGAAYAVTVLTQPPGQNCAVSNGSGTVAGANVTNVVVTCSDNNYNVGVTVSGLSSGSSVILQDNGGDNLTLTANGTSNFNSPVPSGSSYAVTVLTQPVGQSCSVTGGSGTIVSSNVVVGVTCQTALVHGTVARGATIGYASVKITDVNGLFVTTTADSNGNFTANVTGLTAPLMLVATDPTGTTVPLVSVLVSAPIGATVTNANITTLTTAVAALMSPTGNPYSLNLSTQVNATTVSTAVATLNTALASILTANAIPSASFNPISTPLVANNGTLITSLDAVVAAVSLVPQSSGSSGAFQLVSTANPTSVLALSTATTAPAPLMAPPSTAAAGYADYLKTELPLCLAGSTSVCASIVDSGFTHNGYTTLTTAYPDFGLSTAVGVTVGLPQTLRFFTDTNSNQLALVQVPFTLSDATQGSVLMVLKRMSAPLTLADGTVINWNIYGNQRQYDARVFSVIMRRQFGDTKAADVGRYEAGLHLLFNPSGPNAANVNVVNVAGPGLPAMGLYLARSTACGTDDFMVIDRISAAPSSIYHSTSTTNFYRWDWQSLSSTTFVPPVNAAWAPAPVVTTSIPQFAQYTFTLYDSTGAMIGTPFLVENNATPVAASYGQTVHWPILDASFITNFLTPGGSLAAAAASVSVPWALDPLGLPLRLVMASSGPTTGAVVAVDGFAAVPRGSSPVIVNAGQSTSPTNTSSCTGAQFSGLTSGVYRLVQLRSQEPSVIREFDIHQYND